jgi:hypothetical protein
MAVGNEGGICPVCETWAEDYEPGVSATKIDGVWYHPQCARLAEVDREQRAITPDPIAVIRTNLEAMKASSAAVWLNLQEGVASIDRALVAIAEAADHHELVADHDHLLDPDDGLEDWHANEKPKLPEDEGPTREMYDAEADVDREEMTRLLKFATKAIENAISTLRNEQYDRRVNATIADLCNALCELGDYPPDSDESPNTVELKKAYYGTLSGAGK